jgi:hypothetical protein
VKLGPVLSLNASVRNTTKRVNSYLRRTIKAMIR